MIATVKSFFGSGLTTRDEIQTSVYRKFLRDSAIVSDVPVRSGSFSHISVAHKAGARL